MAALDHFFVVIGDKCVLLKISVRMVERFRAGVLLRKGYHSLLVKMKVLAG